MLERLRRRRQQQEGFTLIELLVVVIIIGLLAAIAIPAFMGQRDKANDASAKSLVRNAATTVEAAFVDTRDYSAIDNTQLAAIEPNITFAADLASATAADDAVFYDSTSASYSISSISDSGITYTMTRGADGQVTRTSLTDDATPVAGTW